MLYTTFSLSSASSDYTAIFDKLLEFSRGQQSVQVDVEILDGNILEVLLKTFQANLTLSGPILVTRPDAITIAPDMATVTIRDNDGETVKTLHSPQAYIHPK